MRYNQALLQATEVRRLEGKILAALQKAMNKIRKLALRHKENFQLQPNELRDLERELTDAQVAAHLLGVRRTRLNLVQLSLVDDALKLLKNVTELQLQTLYAKYSIDTQNVLTNLTTKVNASVRDAVADSIASGLATRATVKNIAAGLAKAGITPTNSYYIENIVRTQTQLAYNGARWAEYQTPTFDEILWGYEYVTVGDDRVREEHMRLDGTKLPKDDPFWRTFWPPNGYSCRCQAIPVFEKERIKRPPSDAKPDIGFDFNPGSLLAGIAV